MFVHYDQYDRVRQELRRVREELRLVTAERNVALALLRDIAEHVNLMDEEGAA